MTDKTMVQGGTGGVVVVGTDHHNEQTTGAKTMDNVYISNTDHGYVVVLGAMPLNAGADTLQAALDFASAKGLKVDSMWTGGVFVDLA